MTDDLTPDEEALLRRLDSLFEIEADEKVPSDLASTLKRQVRDRLAPDRLSAGETLALTVLGVVVLGVAGIHSWAPVQVAATAVAVWVFVRAAHWLGKARDPRDE